MKTPLEGIRVLDLSRLVAGNVLTAQLADFGADVIKIERPGRGYDLRHWRDEGVETWWKVYGRNKRSLALDLKDKDALAQLKALVPLSDVFVENFVPGKLEAMGLGVRRRVLEGARAAEAAEAAGEACRLAPDHAAPHRALGRAHRLAEEPEAVGVAAATPRPDPRCRAGRA